MRIPGDSLVGPTDGMSGVGRSGGLTSTTGGVESPPSLCTSTPEGNAAGGKDGPSSKSGHIFKYNLFFSFDF